MSRSTVLVAAAALAAAAAVSAQTTSSKVVPPQARHADANNHAGHPFHFGPSRLQQVIDRRYLIKSAAVITDVVYRREAGGTIGSYAFKAIRLPRFKLEIGVTAKDPASLSTTFAANRTGKMTIGFDGALDLPAQPAVAGPAPFNIIIKLKAPLFFDALEGGHLLIDTTATPPATSYTGYWIDAFQTRPYGRFWIKGTSGRTSGGRRLLLSFGKPLDAVPGGKFTLQLGWATRAYAAGAFLGTSATRWNGLTLPFDLAPLGAPGNRLYTGPELMLPPLAMTRQSNGLYQGTLTVPLLNDVSLAHRRLLLQSFLIDPPANPLGIVLTNRAEVEIGGGLVFSQTAYSRKPGATTGTVYTRRPGGPVVELGGVFQ